MTVAALEPHPPADAAPAGGSRATVRRRASAFLNRHPRLRLGALLVPPLGWMGVIYLGALVLLLVTAFWTLDPLSSAVVHRLTLANVRAVVTQPVYRTIALRTILVAAGATITDVALAFPLAYF